MVERPGSVASESGVMSRAVASAFFCGLTVQLGGFGPLLSTSIGSPFHYACLIVFIRDGNM